MQCGHSNALRMRSYCPGKATASKGERESETEVVEGVESQSSASQSLSHPPANLPSTKSKGKSRRPPTKKNGNNKNRGKKKSKHVMASNKKAIEEENGSRVVVNQFLPVLPGVPAKRQNLHIGFTICTHWRSSYQAGGELFILQNDAHERRHFHENSK